MFFHPNTEKEILHQEEEEEHRKQIHNKYRREKTTDKAINAFIYSHKRERERERERKEQSINQTNKH